MRWVDCRLELCQYLGYVKYLLFKNWTNTGHLRTELLRKFLNFLYSGRKLFQNKIE